MEKDEDSYQQLLGKQGEALSMLRPAGTAMVDGRRLDVLTEGDYIASHSQIKVIRVEGSKIIVKQVAAAPTGESSAS